MSGPRLTTLVRLAAAGGRADRVRVTLTVVAAALGTLALLAAASVALIRSGDGPYRLDILAQPGLRPGTTVAILLLLVPLTVFIGHCFRLGAPARDRRLAAMRMAGATPADAGRIVVAETFLAAVAGSAVGAAAFWLARLRLDRPDADGTLLLPADVSMPLALVALLALVIPVAGAAASVLALRRVLIGPFGVTRRVPSRPPTLTPVILFLGGSGGLLGFQAVAATLGLEGGGGVAPILLLAFVLFVMTAAGLLMGTASLAAAMGRFLAPRVDSPALLIAARRMIAAPHTASRASSAVLIFVLIGGAVQGTRENFLLATDPGDPFYRDTFTLVNGMLVAALVIAAAGLLVVTAEAMVARRRTLAALTASGTPRGVLARAAMAEVLLPLAPAVLLASAAGVLAARGFWGSQVSIGAGQIDPLTGAPAAVQRTLDVPVPWDRVLVLGGATVLVCALMTAVSLVFLRRSTDPAELRAAA